MNGLNHEKITADVCVIGGGMAGICAAIASARNGAKTVLVHDRSVLGGNASSEVRMWICGAHGQNNKETGILEEIQLANLHRNAGLDYSIWDSILWEKTHFQPNLTTLLNCSCNDATMDGSRITDIRAWQSDTQTWFHIQADNFIDCSGDSILAALTPAAWRQGREAASEFGEDIEPEIADNKTMGSSLLIQAHRCDTPQPFTAPSWAYKFEKADFAFRMDSVGIGNFWWLEVGGLNDTIKDNASIRNELMRITYGVWDYIKNRAPDCEKAANWGHHWIGSLPGKRESRRYEGDHIMTQMDIEAEGPFEDCVAFGGWKMDDHHPAGLLYPGRPTIFHPAPEIYGIPYRVLYSRNIDNLLFAGRNISVTHAALSSTRVMATCAVMGQAAGTAAALCKQHSCTPRKVYEHHISQLQQTLMDDDCFLPGLARAIDALAGAAKLTAAGSGTENLVKGIDRDRANQPNGWQGPIGKPIEFTWDSAVNIEGLRVTFDSNLNHDKRLPCAYPVKADRCAMPETLIKDYRIEAQDETGNWQTICRKDDNVRRLDRIPLSVTAKAIRFVPESTWGDDAARIMSLEPVATLVNKIPGVPDGPKFSDVRAKLDPEDLADPAKEIDQTTRVTVGASA